MKNSDRIAQRVETLRKKYLNHFNALEASPLAKVRPLTEMDHYNLGIQLDQFDEYVTMCESDGSASQLGIIPRVAHDVITAVYGTSPLSVIASVQPIEEETGSVYYKSVVARDSRGNVTAGQTLNNSAAAPNVEPLNYAADGRFQMPSGVNTAAGTQQYTFNIPHTPVRRFKVEVHIAPNASFGGLTCKDYEGNGQLQGNGMYGTVNYANGAVVINLVSNPTGDANNRPILLTYAQEMSNNTSLPRISSEFLAKPVSAQVYALQSSIGLEKAWALNKRFGLIADESIAAELTSAINSELCYQAVARLMANTTDDVSWAKTAPAGVPYVDHKEELRDKLAEVDAKILERAGRGTVSAIIAGRDIAATFSTLPGFVKLNVGDTLGPHVFGTIDGIVIIRMPQSGILPSNKAICLYKGTSPFDSAIVYSPYMPLVVTTALPTANPLMNQKAAAIWAAIEVLVPGFASRLVQS